MEFKNPKTFTVRLEKEEFDDFEEIRWREHLDMTELGRKAIQEYIKVHKSGNTTYILDDFSTHKDMIAIPALMSNKETLSNYIKEEIDFKELEKVKDQAKYLVDIINTKMLNTPNPEKTRIEANKSDRFRRMNDIRYKNPKNMSWPQQIHYNQVMSQYTEEQRKEFQKGWKQEDNKK